MSWFIRGRTFFVPIEYRETLREPRTPKITPYTDKDPPKFSSNKPNKNPKTIIPQVVIVAHDSFSPEKKYN